jgi:hypothetical protein
MDIEGDEYICLPQLMPYLRKINGMVVEFHDLGMTWEKFEEILNEISSEFYAAHTHGNNFDRLIYKTNIPNVMEMTFINKKIVPENINLSNKQYPIKGIDAPCDKKKEDFILEFANN